MYSPTGYLHPHFTSGGSTRSFNPPDYVPRSPPEEMMYRGRDRARTLSRTRSTGNRDRDYSPGPEWSPNSTHSTSRYLHPDFDSRSLHHRDRSPHPRHRDRSPQPHHRDRSPQPHHRDRSPQPQQRLNHHQRPHQHHQHHYPDASPFAEASHKRPHHHRKRSRSLPPAGFAPPVAHSGQYYPPYASSAQAAYPQTAASYVPHTAGSSNWSTAATVAPSTSSYVYAAPVADQQRRDPGFFSRLFGRKDPPPYGGYGYYPQVIQVPKSTRSHKSRRRSR